MCLKGVGASVTGCIIFRSDTHHWYSYSLVFETTPLLITTRAQRGNGLRWQCRSPLLCRDTEKRIMQKFRRFPIREIFQTDADGGAGQPGTFGACIRVRSSFSLYNLPRRLRETASGLQVEHSMQRRQASTWAQIIRQLTVTTVPQSFQLFYP